VFRGHTGNYAAERCGFISKLALSNVDYIPPAHGLFGTYIATLQYNNASVRIANVHLTPFVIRRDSSVTEAIQALFAIEAIHSKEINEVVERISIETPTIVCGDFNSLSHFSAPQYLQSMGFLDSFASVNDKPDSVPTWRWPIGQTHIQFRIDYIFHTKHFETLESRLYPASGSDHSIVVSELRLSL
jgi:endonuclease/exonuclease/phosphatase family metal-dependent hydrolase